ncbi:hypothetical protein JW758_05045 [Candidatus Peregrinibacteria bacterium]|nr:hypothetical protein [Candidatus Peregrinibacteria bacterium]
MKTNEKAPLGEVGMENIEGVQKGRAVITEILKNPSDYPELADIDSFVTESGSIYSVLSNKRTQRLKNGAEEKDPAMDAIVFLPDFESLKNIITVPEIIEKIGGSEADFEEIINEYMDPDSPVGRRVYMVDKNKKALRTKEEIDKSDLVFLAFFNNDGKIDFFLPVSKNPQIGYQPFEAKTFKNERGIPCSFIHLGHKITKIIPK